MPSPEELKEFQMAEPQPLRDAMAEQCLDALDKSLDERRKQIMNYHEVNNHPVPKISLDWSVIGGALDQTSQDMVGILKPFLPALARVPLDVYQGFLSHLGNADWDSITTLMYVHMNVQEREQLESQVYQGLKAATLAQYQDRELIKQILVKVAIDLAIKLVTGGIL